VPEPILQINSNLLQYVTVYNRKKWGQVTFGGAV